MANSHQASQEPQRLPPRAPQRAVFPSSHLPAGRNNIPAGGRLHLTTSTWSYKWRSLGIPQIIKHGSWSLSMTTFKKRFGKKEWLNKKGGDSWWSHFRKLQYYHQQRLRAFSFLNTKKSNLKQKRKRFCNIHTQSWQGYGERGSLTLWHYWLKLMDLLFQLPRRKGGIYIL